MSYEITKKVTPEVKSITSIHILTICDAMDTNEVFKEILTPVHKLLCLFNYINNICHSRKTFLANKEFMA